MNERQSQSTFADFFSRFGFWTAFGFVIFGLVAMPVYHMFFPDHDVQDIRTRSECSGRMQHLCVLLGRIFEECAQDLDAEDPPMEQEIIRKKVSDYASQFGFETRGCPLARDQTVPYAGYIFHPLLLTTDRFNLDVLAVEASPGHFNNKYKHYRLLFLRNDGIYFLVFTNPEDVRRIVEKFARGDLDKSDWSKSLRG